MEVKILYNYGDENLYCCECKEKILPFEKFGIITEQLYDGEIIEKCYHIDCIPEVEEDAYIIPEE
jgi:hypothetical protein